MTLEQRHGKTYLPTHLGGAAGDRHGYFEARRRTGHIRLLAINAVHGLLKTSSLGLGRDLLVPVKEFRDCIQYFLFNVIPTQ